MSKSIEVPYLDDEFKINETVPTTLAELAEAGINEQDVIEGCVSDLRYRNKYPRVYKKASKLVAERHSFARAVAKQIKRKDGTFRDELESPMDHLRAFLNGRKDDDGNVTVPAPEGSRETLQGILTEVGPAEPIWVKGERAGVIGKVSQAAQDAANGIFAQGSEVVEQRIAVIEENVPGFKVDRDEEGNATPESLARAIMALEKELKRQAEVQKKALLG